MSLFSRIAKEAFIVGHIVCGVAKDVTVTAAVAAKPLAEKAINETKPMVKEAMEEGKKMARTVVNKSMHYCASVEPKVITEVIPTAVLSATAEQAHKLARFCEGTVATRKTK